MTPERWAQAKEVFDAALDQPERGRAAFLAAACLGDADLRVQVGQLLAASQEASWSPAATVLPAATELAPGDTAAHYRIEAKLGEGGMGVVYRAFDMRLHREVALKFLLPERLADPESRQRLVREARAASALNHPNICTIHGLEDSGQQPVIVMEVVQGDTLAGRLEKGRLPLETALAVAAQIADALIAAHGRGIIHRDLKPGNIMLTGPKNRPTVKVMDFGLAKMEQPVSAESMQTTTGQGAIMGTLHYMSPEQLQGKPADARSDIFSFGLIVYEMITGARAFDGSSSAGVIAAILEREPPPSEPGWLDRVLRACVAKAPHERFQSTLDLKRAIEWSGSNSEVRSLAPRRPHRLVPWTAAAALAGLAFVVGSRTGAVAVPASRLALSIAQPASAGWVGGWPDISPDGSSLLYGVAGGGGLWVRRLDSLEPVLLRGAKGALDSAFWSADSQAVVVRLPAGLFRLRVPDGAPELIAKSQGYTRGGSWSDTGTILISHLNHLYYVPASGGELKLVDTAAVKPGALVRPQFLPGGNDFLFLLDPEQEGAEIYLATLRNGRAVNVSLLLKNETTAWYTPAGGGKILYVQEDNLYSRKLDLRRRSLEGDAELVQRGVASSPGLSNNRPAFSISRSGVLAWLPGKATRNQVTIFDRHGQEAGRAGPPGAFLSLALSPDETRLLVSGEESWLVEPGQPGGFNLGKMWDWLLWMPDGSHLLGLQESSGKLAERSVNIDDAREIGRTGFDATGLHSLSPDGRRVLAATAGRGLTSFVLPGLGGQGASSAVIQVNGPAAHAEFAPDGRWIVYSAGNRTSQDHGIYVQPFPGPGLRKQIADATGVPVWRKDGREIVIANDLGVWSVKVEAAAGGLRFGAPEFLFPGLRWPSGYNLAATPLAVSRDGSRIYFIQGVEQPDYNVINILTGWAR